MPVRRVRLCLEVLADRLTPSVVTINVNDNRDVLDNAANVTVAQLGTQVSLRDALNAANNDSAKNPGNSYVINLQANTTYDLTAIDNFWYGPNGLPAISSNLTIDGNFATIERGSDAMANFRLFYVSGGFDGLAAGNLTLNDLTLEGGVAKGGDGGFGGGGGGLGAGGAIFNQGMLHLTSVTLFNNQAIGGSGEVAGLGDSGGGMGQDAQGNDGGGFGGPFPGGSGGGGGDSAAAGGGGGGFQSGDGGGNASGSTAGAGGGQGGFGGNGGGGGLGGDGGGNAIASIDSGGNGGAFGSGGGGVPFGGGGGGGGTNAGGGAGMGGAIFNMFGSATLTNCTLTANSAQGGNAPVVFAGGGGSGYGGAVFNLDGTLNLTFCTVADNTVTAGTGGKNGDAAGGAVYNLAYGNKISDGSAQAATATITDSILSNSSGGVDLVNNVVNGKNTNTATVTLSEANLVMSSTGTIGGTPTVTSDPQLGSLQNNGGPTQTMAITSSSPAYRASTPISGITIDQRGHLRPLSAPSLGAFEPQVATTTTASNATATFSTSTQNVMLSATVSSDAGAVNEGTVTFLVKQGSKVIGTATTSDTVSNGQASVSYLLPASLAPGTYTIDATYNPGTDFIDSFDTTHTLTVSPASTTTTANNATATFDENAQNVMLAANVSSGAGAVNEGTVTFTVKQGSTVLGTATTSGTVSNGVVSVSYALPAGTGAGTYTIDAVYDPGTDFTTSEDTTHTLTVNAASTTTTANNATATFNQNAQNVLLSATVSSGAGPVNEGTVTFTLKQGGTVIGTATTSDTVSNGQASVSYVLPAGTAANTYTLDAVYNPGSDFTTSSDTTHTLTICSAPQKLGAPESWN